MRKGDILRKLKTMPPEDRRVFDRWLKANAIFGLIFAAGIIAMALAGSYSAGPRHAATANSTKASDVAADFPALKPRHGRTGVLSTNEVIVRGERELP